MIQNTSHNTRRGTQQINSIDLDDSVHYVFDGHNIELQESHDSTNKARFIFRNGSFVCETFDQISGQWIQKSDTNSLKQTEAGLQILDKNSMPSLTIGESYIDCHQRQLIGLQSPKQQDSAVSVEFMQKFVSELSIDTVPLGVIVPICSENIPVNFLLCDGSQYDKCLYPDLFEYLQGKDKVPDLRGYFIRGFDPQGVVDPQGASRQLGSVQADDNKQHLHSYNDTVYTQEENQSLNPSGSIMNSSVVTRKPTGSIQKATEIMQTMIQGTESRPKNIAFNYIIKATKPHLGSAHITKTHQLDMNNNSILNVRNLIMSDNTSSLQASILQASSTDGTIEMKSGLHITGRFGSEQVSNGSEQVSNISLQCDNDILCNELRVTSSKTIKHVLDSSKDFYQSVVDTIKSLKFSKYKYKDSIQFGEGIHYGIIAEEVFQILPDIVNSTMRFVPDIYRKATAKYCEFEYDGTRNSYLRLDFDEHLDEFINSFQQDTNLTPPIGNKLKLICNRNNSPLILETLICKIGSNYILTETTQALNDKEITLLSTGLSVFVYGTFQSVMAVAKDRLMEQGLITIQYILEKLDSYYTQLDQLNQHFELSKSHDLASQMCQLHSKVNLIDSQSSEIYDKIVQKIDNELNHQKQLIKAQNSEVYEKIDERLQTIQNTDIQTGCHPCECEEKVLKLAEQLDCNKEPQDTKLDELIKKLADQEQGFLTQLKEVVESQKKTELTLNAKINNYDNVIQKMIAESKQSAQIISQMQQQLLKLEETNKKLLMSKSQTVQEVVVETEKETAPKKGRGRAR